MNHIKDRLNLFKGSLSMWHIVNTEIYTAAVSVVSGFFKCS